MSAVRKAIALLCVSLAIFSLRAHAQETLSHQIAGYDVQYTIQRGDNFIKLGSRFGVGAAVIASQNGLQITSPLTAGNTLEIDNQHIVPTGIQNGILINLPQRMLFYFENGDLIAAYPAAVGRVAPQWQTTTGRFRIIQLREDPTWHVPPFDQARGRNRRQGHRRLRRAGSR